MDNKTINMNDDEVEIDLLQLFRALKKRILWIVGAGVIMGGAFGLFSKFAITPQYTSTSMVYILSKETTLTSLADLQIGSQLTKDYSVMITSRPSSEYIGDIMEMVPPKVIEEGTVSDKKASPSNGKNAMIGAMLGIVLVCGLTVVEELLNDTIQTEEDVEKYMGLTVLASVPLREGEAEENKNEQTLSRSHMHNKDDKKKGKQGDRK